MSKLALLVCANFYWPSVKEVVGSHQGLCQSNYVVMLRCAFPSKLERKQWSELLRYFVQEGKLD